MALGRLSYQAERQRSRFLDMANLSACADRRYHPRSFPHVGDWYRAFPRLAGLLPSEARTGTIILRISFP